MPEDSDPVGHMFICPVIPLVSLSSKDACWVLSKGVNS